jgi:N-succinyldiaminopimelate aminotransferase
MSKKNLWSSFGTSIFTQMTQLAMQYDAINLAQGFPNFDGPQEIKNAVKEALDQNFNQYAPSTGLPQLREALATRFNAQTKLDFCWQTETTVFSGATEALFCTFSALFDEGDEILTFAPYFDCYPAGAFAVKAKLVDIPLETSEWTFDPDRMRSKINSRTKAILVNNPHNPTGRVFSKAELQSIADLALQHNLIVITDEVYDELVFDNTVLTRMAQLPGMRDRTITISSTAKTFSFTGWKIGYVFAHPKWTNEMRAVHQFTVFCSATPLQAGMVAAFKLPSTFYDSLRKDYTARRDHLYEGLTQLGFKIRKPQGTYFLVADYSNFSKDDDITFSNWLTSQVKVAVIPTSVFYNDQAHARTHYRCVRFAYCKDLDTLSRGLENLKSGLK